MNIYDVFYKINNISISTKIEAKNKSVGKSIAVIIFKNVLPSVLKDKITDKDITIIRNYKKAK